jgi:hypothetical protein
LKRAVIQFSYVYSISVVGMQQWRSQDLKTGGATTRITDGPLSIGSYYITKLKVLKQYQQKQTKLKHHVIGFKSCFSRKIIIVSANVIAD